VRAMPKLRPPQLWVPMDPSTPAASITGVQPYLGDAPRAADAHARVEDAGVTGSPSSFVLSPPPPLVRAPSNGTNVVRGDQPSLLPRKLMEDLKEDDDVDDDDEAGVTEEDAMLTFIKPPETVVMQPVRPCVAASVNFCRGCVGVPFLARLLVGLPLPPPFTAQHRMPR
jgi:hypothetical protein